MFLVRILLIAFMGTLSFYVTSPAIISSIGFAGILTQVALRFVGSSLYKAQCGLDDHFGGHDGEDKDRKWPNVTEPRIEKKHVERNGNEGERKWPNVTNAQIKNS